MIYTAQINANWSMNTVNYTPAAYRAYLQMSYRKHILVEDDREKMITVASLDELASEIEQDINVDVDNADFLLAFQEPITNREKVDHIYASVVDTPYAHKLIKLTDGIFIEPANTSFDGNLSCDLDSTLRTRVDELLRLLLARGIVVPQLTEVKDYLFLHPDMPEVLPSVAQVISEQFATQTQLSLEVYNDPEVKDKNLTFYVRQQQYDANILDSIKAAREKYRKYLVGKSGWIHLTTDFDYPG